MCTEFGALPRLGSVRLLRKGEHSHWFELPDGNFALDTLLQVTPDDVTVYVGYTVLAGWR